MGYRSVHTGKRLAVWLVIRMLGFGVFVLLAVSAGRRGDTTLMIMGIGFAIAMSLHLIELLLAVAQIKTTNLPR